MGKASVLVIDDDHLFCQAVKAMLAEHDFEVFLAPTGWEGLEVAATCNPDLFLVEVGMPVMDGMETCRQLRDIPSFKHHPIILMTSQVEMAGRVNPFHLGADDYLPKPFSASELNARLQGSLLKKRAMEACEREARTRNNQAMLEIEGGQEESALLKNAKAGLEDELCAKTVYEQLFENASDGLAAFTGDGRLLFANRKALEIFRYSRQEVLGRNLASLVDGRALRRILLWRRRPAAQQDHPPPFDLPVRIHTGERRCLSTSLNAKPVCQDLWVAVFRDVTEKRVIERELLETKAVLEQANERLTRLDRARAEFLNAAAHDLRIPVTVIQGYCSLLLDQGADNLTPEQRGYLQAAVASSDRLVDLVESLLNLSRLEAGKMVLDIDRRDLALTLENVLRDFHPLAQQGGLELHLDAPHNCHAPFDEEYIRRVLLNLVSNAVKFTPAGGRIHLSVDQRDREVLVTVADTGKGIPADRLSELFEEFTQLGPDDYRQGSGLGLSICKKIIEAHHGSLWAESTLGTGSRFCFTLPIAD